MSQDDIIIFWDYASTHVLSASTTISNYDLVGNIRSACLELGLIKSFRAYGNFSGQISARISTAHSELAASGVTVIDFPDNVRKEAGVKTMLVDMITHAWDYPTGHTYVIITGDRDVAYAIAILRMRKIKVVVISSATAHPDLTAHASVKLDWTKTVLGYQNLNGTTHFMNPLASKPSPSEKPAAPSLAQQSHTESPFSFQFNKASSNAQPRKPFEATIESESVELRDIQPRGRRHSVFSTYDPRNSEGFGDIGDAALTPKTQRGLFGFGDGPLFPRHGEERPRAESVPPQAFHPSNLSKSAYPPFPQKATSLSITSSGKGKAREFSAYEPENFPPPLKVDAPYSGSVFEPFGDTATSFGTMSAFPPSENRAATISRSSSSSSSQPTDFSIVKRLDTTAPTSTKSEAVDDHYKPSVDEQPDAKVSQMTLSHTDEPISSSTATEVALNESILPPTKDDPPTISAATSRRNSTSTIEARSQISQATEHEPIRTLKPVLKTPAAIPTVQPIAGPSQPAVPKPAIHSPTPAPKPKPKVPTANPSIFQPLITVMRTKRGAVPKSSLGPMLIKQNSRVYELAGITASKKLKVYITAAIKAGIVSETTDTVTLSAEYRT